MPNFLSSTVFRKTLSDVFFADSSKFAPAAGVLLDAATAFVGKMQNSMQEALDLLVDKTIQDFPRMDSFVRERVLELLAAKAKSVVVSVEAVIKAELAKPHTYNHYYMDTVTKVRSAIMETSLQLMGADKSKRAVRKGDRVAPGRDWVQHYGSRYPKITMQSKGTVMNAGSNSTADVHWDDGTVANSVYNGHGDKYALLLIGDECSSIDGVSPEFIQVSAKSFAEGQSNSAQGVLDMQISLFAYTKCMTKIVLDVVPKLVWSELVHGVNEDSSSFVQDELSADKGALRALMAEDPHKAAMRKRKETTVKRFKDALKVLQRTN